MASNPPGACCASGFKHEGAPTGELKKIDGCKILKFPQLQPKSTAEHLLTKLFSSKHLYRPP
jgi:hypothetical protein